MRVNPQPPRLHCSLTHVIERHLQGLFRDTGVSLTSFVSNVRAHYEASVFLHSRSIEWSQAADVYTRMTRDAEKFGRWLGDGVQKQLPIDLLESIIASFPDDRRFRLQIELAARQGMIAIPMPSGTPAEDGLFLGRVAKEVGDVLIDGAQLLEDGVIDSKDREAALKLLVDADEAVAVLLAFKHHVSMAALGKSSGHLAGVIDA